MTSILIVDDDVDFCMMLRDYLASHQIELASEHTAAAGMSALESGAFDLLLLDMMLPDLDGLEVLCRVRRRWVLPVLMLSAEGSEENRIAGLDRGADDYLPKPFNPRELVSRIHAILRRFEQRRSIASPAEERSGGLAFNVSARQAFYRGRQLPLTDAEFNLLTVFVQSPGTILEREDLVTRVFQRPFNPLDRSLDMHVSRLRRKLVALQEFADPIKTIRNAGYLFTPPSLGT